MEKTKKFYAVKKGKRVGIYNNWTECKNQIENIPDAIYKSFQSIEEAEEWMGLQVIEPMPNRGEAEAIAYLAGEFNEQENITAGGIVLLWDGQEYNHCFRNADDQMIQMRNMAGELKAAESSIQFCLNNSIPTLDIYYQDEGLACWSDGKWMANKPGTAAYQQFCQESRRYIDVRYIKRDEGECKYVKKAIELAGCAAFNAPIREPQLIAAWGNTFLWDKRKRSTVPAYKPPAGRKPLKELRPESSSSVDIKFQNLLKAVVYLNDKITIEGFTAENQDKLRVLAIKAKTQIRSNDRE